MKVDLLVYPMAFCYRHGIELYLKHLLNEYAKLGGASSFEKSHKLLDNWKALVKAAGAGPSDVAPPPKIMRKAAKVITQFFEIDPTGQVFRYPEDIKGSRHLTDQALINLEVLATAMRELSNFFDDWSTCLEVYVGEAL